MTDVVLYAELDGLDEDARAAFLAEAATAGFTVDELYAPLGVESPVITVLSTLLGAMVGKLAEIWGAGAGEKLAELFSPLFNRKERQFAIEDRDTRITVIWDVKARRDLKVAAAALIEVANSLHLIADRTVFRWDATAQRWYSAPH